MQRQRMTSEPPPIGVGSRPAGHFFGLLVFSHLLLGDPGEILRFLRRESSDHDFKDDATFSAWVLRLLSKNPGLLTMVRRIVRNVRNDLLEGSNKSN